MMTAVTYEDTYKSCVRCDHGTYVVYGNDSVTRCRYCGDVKALRAPAPTTVTKTTPRGKTSE